MGIRFKVWVFIFDSSILGLRIDFCVWTYFCVWVFRFWVWVFRFYIWQLILPMFKVLKLKVNWNCKGNLIKFLQMNNWLSIWKSGINLLTTKILNWIEWIVNVKNFEFEQITVWIDWTEDWRPKNRREKILNFKYTEICIYIY